MNELSIRQLGVKIDKLSDAIYALDRRFGDLQRLIETMDEDRGILERIQTAIRSVEESVLSNKQHIDTIFKSLKLEVQVQGQRTEDKMDSVKDKVEEHVGDLVETIGKKKTVLIKETFLQRFKKWIGGDKK
jgi:predicted  nucleic acid-binding Zn-ribbon protein